MAERTVVTRVSNAILYSDGSIRVDNGRCSYPHVGTPKENENDDGSKKKVFAVELMLPKATHTPVKDLIQKEIQKLLSEKKDKVGSSNWFLKDGDKLATEAEENGKDRELLRGHWVVRVADTRRPSARDRAGAQMTPEEADQEFYGGMYANVLLRPWYFNGKGKNGKTYPKRVLANFIAIQKIRDGEPFGEGRISDDGVFDAIDSEDGGSDGFDDDGL